MDAGKRLVHKMRPLLKGMSRVQWNQLRHGCRQVLQTNLNDTIKAGEAGVGVVEEAVEE